MMISAPISRFCAVVNPAHNMPCFDPFSNCNCVMVNIYGRKYRITDNKQRILYQPQYTNRICTKCMTQTVQGYNQLPSGATRNLSWGCSTFGGKVHPSPRFLCPPFSSLLSLDQFFVVLILNRSALDTRGPQPGMILQEALD